MALLVQKTGLVTLKIEFVNGQFTDVGQAMDMTDIREIPYLHNVPGDKNGGNQGPPIEVQYLGGTARIRMEMSRWDTTALNLLRAWSKNIQGNVQQSDVGTLMLQAHGHRVILDAIDAPLPLSFPCCIVRDPISYGVGTKFSAMLVEFEAHRHPVTGILYDSNVTAGTTTTLPPATTTTTTGA